MSEIGKKCTLRVIKRVDFGMYLDGGELGEVLIPKRYVPVGCKPDDMLDVFLYLDSDDRPIATTEEPYVQVGECTHLKVVSTDDFGAFMDWGLTKDLLVPFKEQRKPMREGKSYTVFVFIDASGRIAASGKLSSFLQEEDDGCVFIKGQLVNLQVASRSDLGFKVVIDNTHLGLINHKDLLQPVNVGEQMEGYIKNVREDGRINVILQAKGEGAIDSLSQDILDFIAAEGGSTDVTDKSPPELIYKAFNVSKSSYKKALGKLYKEQRIIIEEGAVRLV